MVRRQRRLKVLERAIARPDYCERLVTIFNDKDEANVRVLEQAIGELPVLTSFVMCPQVWNEEVGTEIANALVPSVRYLFSRSSIRGDTRA